MERDLHEEATQLRERRGMMLAAAAAATGAGGGAGRGAGGGGGVRGGIHVRGLGGGNSATFLSPIALRLLLTERDFDERDLAFLLALERGKWVEK